MAAFQRRFGHARQEAEDRHAAFPLYRSLQRRVDTCAHAVQDHPCDPGGLPQDAVPFDGSRDGQGHSPAVHHQQRERVQRAGRLPRGCLRRIRRQAVVVAHDALDDVQLRGKAQKGAPHPLFPGEEEVQVRPGYAHDLAVKQRVDIVWPAFEGRCGDPPVHKSLQERQRHHCLPAAASRPRDQDPRRALSRASARRQPLLRAQCDTHPPY